MKYPEWEEITKQISDSRFNTMENKEFVQTGARIMYDNLYAWFKQNENVNNSQPEPPIILPPMDDELRWILGQLCFQIINIAKILRKHSAPIKTKAEDEQANVIYWMLNLYLQHGKDWRDIGDKLLKEYAEA